MIQVSVIIVTWNAAEFISKCLDSVFAQDQKKIEVIVVDNGSTDATISILKSYLPKIRLIKNKENKGFCFANNQALQKAKGEYILTLNSDIVLDVNYISSLREFLVKHPQVGMVQGKFLKLDKKTIDGIGLHLSLFMRMYNIGGGQTDQAHYSYVRDIFGPCAAAALYKKKLLEDIRYKNEFFDNKFFFLVEDFDLAWRARKKGWKAAYVPEAVCYHYRDSSQHNKSFRQYLSFRNRYFMLIKNGTYKTTCLFIISMFVYDLPRLVLLLLINPYATRAIKEVYDYFPELLKRRHSAK